MKLTWDDIQSNAIAFSKRWRSVTSEKQQDQGFIEALLRVFGVDDPRAEGRGTFQEKTRIEGSVKWIDYLWKGKIAIEMKSKGENLDAAFEQLRQYMYSLAEEDVPDLWMVSDFENIRLSRRSTNETWSFKTKDLRKHIKRFADVAGYDTERDKGAQIEVNVKAAEKMAALHDELKGYGYEGYELEVYLVRLLFCMFAEDTGIFPQDQVLKYIEQSKPDGSDLTYRISDLFEVLNMPPDIRQKKTMLSEELKRFRYINGNLFAQRLPPADFNAKMRRTLIECLDFDWNKISPAIFGAMFQGVMDKAKRREMGAHYTSEENILKLINPLFMDELWREFDLVKTDPQALDRFHDKIARLRFLDPACGCGNFLIIAYGKLRELELEILKMKFSTNQLVLDISPMLKVSVEQFYGIEYEEFPCQIARVGMWLIDHQMNLRVSEQFGMYYARLPLTQGATIIHGNALRLDWEEIAPKHELSYIMGNPPFSGRRYRTPEQIEEVNMYFTYKDIDYVACWFKKAARMIQNTNIGCAFVATNSITQGEQVAALWEELTLELDIEIDFAYRTFKWSNEAKGQASVYCVIVGFSTRNRANKSASISANKSTSILTNSTANISANSTANASVNSVEWANASINNTANISTNNTTNKALYYYDEFEATQVAVAYADNINGYLQNAPNAFIKVRSMPLCDAPPMKNGNVPLDGDALKIEEADYPDFADCRFVKKLIGGRELLHNEKRYVLWLVDANPAELRKLPKVMHRIEMCRQARLKAKDAGTRKLAEMPMLFRDTNNPDSYIALPMVSSERRRYVPMAYLDGGTIPTNQVQTIPNATLYHFGVLTSNVHMAWTRAVCGRLEMRYRYSKDIVYNNFPWPDATDGQKTIIEKLAQTVLDVRARYPDSSLADLYDPLAMPPDLLKAHRALDAAVMRLYGFPVVKEFTESDCVAALMTLYQELTR